MAPRNSRKGLSSVNLLDDLAMADSSSPPQSPEMTSLAAFSTRSKRAHDELTDEIDEPTPGPSRNGVHPSLRYPAMSSPYQHESTVALVNHAKNIASRNKLKTTQATQLTDFAKRSLGYQLVDLYAAISQVREFQVAAEASAIEKWKPSVDLNFNIQTFAKAIIGSPTVKTYLRSPVNVLKQIVYRCKWDIPDFVLKTPSAKKQIQEACEDALTQARGSLKKKIAMSLSPTPKLDSEGKPTKEMDLTTCWHLFDLADELTKSSNDGADLTASYELLARLAILRDVYWRVDKTQKYWNTVDQVLDQLREKYTTRGPEGMEDLQKYLRRLVRKDRSTFGVDDESKKVTMLKDAAATSNEIENEVNELIAATNEAGLMLVTNRDDSSSSASGTSDRNTDEGNGNATGADDNESTGTGNDD